MIDSKIINELTSEKRKEIDLIPVNKKLFWKAIREASNKVLADSGTVKCLKSGCLYQFTDSNIKYIETILKYFMNDPTFNNHGLIKNNASLTKGFYVSGDVGVGKSLLFEIIRTAGVYLFKKYNYDRAYMKGISCGSFVHLYMKYSTSKHSDFDVKYFYKNIMYIDDLGVEPLAFNSYELLEQVLFERHKNKALTFITSNLKPSELGERYGKRIFSRLPEMCNIIDWKGADYRENL